MNNINEKIAKMVENEQMPCINARDLKSKADEYNKNYESYKKELCNVIKAINKKITTEAEQGKYKYEGHLVDVNKLGEKFDQFTDDLINYYVERSFKVFFIKQLDCSYKYTIRWNDIPDDDNSKECYSLNETHKELQKTFTNKNIIFTKDQIEIAPHGTHEGIVISFYGEVWMSIVCLSADNPYIFINSNGDFIARVESFKELVDTISKQFNIITKEQNLDVDQYEYNNIDKTFDYLKNFFKDKNVSFSRIFDTDKNEFIVAAIPYRHRLQIACCDDTKHYCVEDTRDDVRIGDFNTLIKLINIIEAYIID